MHDEQEIHPTNAHQVSDDLQETLDLGIHITDVKRGMMAYLKTYYKGYNRVGEYQYGYDMETSAGHIVDGMLTFRVITIEEDVNTFTSTFEAVTTNSLFEVIYRYKDKLLFWDALSFGLLLPTLYLAFGYALGWKSVVSLPLQSNIIFFLFAALSIFVALHFILKSFTRYRYIFALEQFKDYEADEQWIALGENCMLTNSSSFEELRKQCTYSGFGLVVIDKNREATTVITPARSRVIEQKRKKVSFLSKSQLGQRLGNQPFMQQLNKLPTQLALQKSKFIMRYQQFNINQILVSLTALLLAGFVFYRIWHQDSEFDYAEDADRLLENELAKNDVRKTDEASVVSAAANTPINGEPVMFVADKTEEYAIEDCSRLYNIKGEKYVANVGEFPKYSMAMRQVRRFQQKGIRCGYIWEGCMSNSDKFIVFLEDIVSTQKEANVIAAKHKQWEPSVRTLTIKE